MTQYRATVRIEVADDNGRVRLDAEQFVSKIVIDTADQRTEATEVVADASEAALRELCAAAGNTTVTLPDTAAALQSVHAQHAKIAV